MITRGTITIVFDENEINALWSVATLAKHYHDKCIEEGGTCLTLDELKLANDLINLTERIK